MALDWSKVEQSVVGAIAGVLGQAWQTNYPAGLSQIQAIIASGEQIEADQAGPTPMSQADYDTLKVIQLRALDGVLQGYESIGAVAAQQAAAAAWKAVTTALAAAYPAIGLIL